MSIRSMTGFARQDGALDGATWHWEVRSVNNRALDVRLRLPPGFEALEPAAREAVAKRVTRGSVSVNLRAQRATGEPRLRLNETALAEAIRAAERVRALTGAEPARVEGLLAIRGVLDVVDEPEDEAATARVHAAMLRDLTAAVDAMVGAREAEGGRLKGVLEAQVAEIEGRVAAVESAPGRRPEAIATRLRDLVQRLTQSANGLDPDRLHQEAVLLATRSDVEEELKRLQAHIAAARELFREEGAIGRKLDFLAQEFNREANTLTSKANDPEIARHGLALKAVIDQMREQVQNIE
jgi:uncharacterized protein (TIGR00255 family)